MSCRVIYKPIPGYPGYEAGSNGTIWSKRGRLSGTVVKGYLKVGLPEQRNGSHYVRKKYVHVLILEAFRGQCPSGKQSRHLDDKKQNNHLWNLVWGTPVENKSDARRNGRLAIGERCHTAKLTADQVISIRKLYRRGRRDRLAQRFGITNQQMHSILNKKSWKHV